MATTTGVVNKRLVSAISMMDTREINPNIIDEANEMGFDDIMRLVGRYKKTDQPNYHHFVNEDLNQILEFDTAGVAGSGTATLTVTITSTGYARRDDKLLFKNGKVGKISSAITTASSKDSFTITSVDGTNLTAVATDKVSVIGTAVGEKSKATESLVYRQTKYFNLIEILRDKTSITDIQKASKIETANGNYAYVQAINQAIAFKQRISATLVAGQKSVNEFGTSSPSLTDKDGNSMQTTGGFTNEIEAYGVKDTVSSAGTVGATDVDDLLDQLLAVKAPSNYVVFSPDKAWRVYDNHFKNLNSSGVTGGRLSVDSKEVNYNVTKFTKGKFSLEFASLPILDHPQLLSFTGGPSIGKNVYGIPKDKVKVQGNGGVEPRIGVRYIENPQLAMNRGTSIIQEYYDGGLAPGGIGDEQVLTTHFITRQGMEALGVKPMFRQIVSS